MRRQEDANDHNLPLLVWYGLIPVALEDPRSLASVATSSTWPKTQRFIAHRLAEGIDQHPSAVDQLPDARVIEWDEWPIVGRHDRFNSMLKPAYIGFYRRARKWIRRELAAGNTFDLIHQVAPLALRYACPAIGPE